MAKDRRRHIHIICKWVSISLYVCGGIIMLIALIFFPMYYLLRKRNAEKDQDGVQKLLKTICCLQGGIVIFFSLLSTGILAVILPLLDSFILFKRGIFLYLYFEIVLPTVLALTTITVFYFVHVTVFYSLNIHGIRYYKPEYIKAFITFQYFLLIFFNTVVSITSIFFSTILHQFWIFFLGNLIISCSTFLWIFNTGVSITVHANMINEINNRKENFRYLNNHEIDIAKN